MEKLIITGRKKLKGTISVSGAKNSALKIFVAACLTEEKVVIHNVPLISDIYVMAQVIEELGGKVEFNGHTAIISLKKIKNNLIPLDKAAQVRASVLFIAPLLARMNKTIIPNPGGCRLGARPVDRITSGLEKMNVEIIYNTQDGFFHAQTTGLKGVTYRFDKNSHTGTEALIIAAVLAEGKTILQNAAEEPEIDELIDFLIGMGAKISKSNPREITIIGVKKLHGTEVTILPDRNEIITFAIAAILTDGEIFIKDANKVDIKYFLKALEAANAKYEIKTDGIRFFTDKVLRATDITTHFHPGFMTDWQGPWAVLMSKAIGQSTIHETIFENRFGYVEELLKMGAKINYYDPKVKNPKDFYNFNYDEENKTPQSIKIHGKTNLHNAIVNASDLRAGATLVLGALAAHGTSILFGVERLDRGYEKFEERLQSLGADIRRERE